MSNHDLHDDFDGIELAQDNADLDHMEQMLPEDATAGIPDDEDNEHDQFLSDAEADGDALASCGFGTDEDYGGGCGGEE